MSIARVASEPRADAFRHEALLYAGIDEFLEGTLAFIRGGVEAGEPMLVVVDDHKIAALRAELGSDAEAVCFADMADVGHNPARIIPAWHDFVGRHVATGRPLRGIGEPIGPRRGPDELVECQRHESLLNLAFADASAFWLLCPYDTEAMDDSVIEEARCSHPYVGERRPGGERSAACRDLHAIAAPFDVPLAEPVVEPASLPFGGGPLGPVRAFVARQAESAGLGATQTSDLVLAANEVATNSLCHGGGDGILRMWRQGDTLVCEVRDGGFIDDPLAGRRRPATYRDGGRGLWLANQLCDLVQIRSNSSGTVVRMHMRRR
ncbi:MAG TPA: sensor histidine kinase [Acidimicrobiales bacterium]|nr:sensor histidine kinase [Acidimicrobiales bacterium]